MKLKNNILHDRIEQNIFNLDQYKIKLKQEKILLRKYQKELSVFSRKKITLPAILAYEYYRELAKYIKKVHRSVRQIDIKLDKFCYELAKKICKNSASGDKKEVKYCLLGFLLLESKLLILEDELTEEEVQMIAKYRKKVKKTPHHPYRIADDPDNLIASILLEDF